ncbi:phosphoglycerate mutase [Pontibacillus halophilus JSM 076056 = DSM 19796]|uniref:Phosphoglycerate mutase n=1 Tax=Pontibacillus halophilus JSM 076056 = DSM 19796 TaxID=1385510 RepID=A0A0A5GMZ2_9BACI|nr:histidine phosphatase family protein [Pontibacillus halophilus]KGX93364.1 phosphoglycerate mutase [Pontibacillus halophilus JSM 076056 = DSM 19796]
MIAYFTRHGQTKWNTEHRMQGRQNSPLTSLGKEQAHWLGHRLKHTRIDHIVASPSERTKETAGIVNEYLNVPLSTDERIMEIAMGEWEGKTKAEIEKEYPESAHHFWNEPHLFQSHGGESFHDVHARVTDVINDVSERYQGEHVLFVTHGTMLKVLQVMLEEKDIEQLWEGAYMQPTSLSKVSFEEEHPSIFFMGDTSHYRVD